MRPPQKTGENFGYGVAWRVFDAASMRPPQKTGENDKRREQGAGRRTASMRPPQKTGENRLKEMGIPHGYMLQ